MFTSPNVSHITCQVSHVTCHVSRVTFHVSHVTCHIFFSFFFRPSGEVHRWRVCYQRGSPRLVCVSSQLVFNHILYVHHNLCLITLCVSSQSVIYCNLYFITISVSSQLKCHHNFCFITIFVSSQMCFITNVFHHNLSLMTMCVFPLFLAMEVGRGNIF